jgi:hypothetical protein
LLPLPHEAILRNQPSFAGRPQPFGEAVLSVGGRVDVESVPDFNGSISQIQIIWSSAIKIE